jgi:hypothetical protein
MSDNNKIITIHKVDLGFDVEKEIEDSLKSEISEDIIEDAKDIIDAISDRPENKNAIAKIETEKKLEECINIVEEHGKIGKDQMCSITGLNTISAVGKLRNFVKKNYNKKFGKLSKKVDDYGFLE